MIQSVWLELPIRFGKVELDVFIVMPNHFHGIVLIRPESIGGHKGCPDGDNCRGESCIRPGIKGDHEDRPYGVGVWVDHEDRPYDTGGTVDHKDRPHGTLPNSIGRIVQAFKSLTTHAYIKGVKDQGWLPFPGKLWQRNYWDRVIRNESELNDIRKYIVNNPARWESRKSL
jgi:REP element-mobilizing transposase RayT